MNPVKRDVYTRMFLYWVALLVLLYVAVSLAGCASVENPEARWYQQAVVLETTTNALADAYEADLIDADDFLKTEPVIESAFKYLAEAKKYRATGGTLFDHLMSGVEATNVLLEELKERGTLE